MGAIGNVLVGVASVSFGGVALGYTVDGVWLSVRTDLNEIQTINLPGVKKRIIVSQKLEVTVNLAEGSLANLSKAIPGSSLTGATLTLGAANLQSGALVLIGKNPSGGNRTITLTEVNPIGEVRIPYRKAAISVVPVVYGAIIQSDGTFGTIVDS